MNSTCKKASFTTRTANETLPLVRAIVGDIVELAAEINETQQRLAYLGNGRNLNSQDPYSEELNSMHSVIDEKSRRLQHFLDELMALNIDATHAEQGYIHFPAMRQGENIFLCWKHGDGNVVYWHGMDEDCDQRRLIDLPIIQEALAN